MGMKDQKAAKEIAERRMMMIAPLIGALSSQEEYYAKRREISAEYEVSTRTLQRYVDAYNESGMDGLQPKGKADCAVKYRPAAFPPLSASLNWREKWRRMY